MFLTAVKYCLYGIDGQLKCILRSLPVTDPPEVSIVGYDDNWYMGRTDAVLVCQHDANPAPTTVEWTV